MKNKYHILNESPKVSDRELEGYMDFDALINDSADISGAAKSDSKKYWLLGLLTALIVAGIGLWYFPKSTANTKETSTSIIPPEFLNEETKVNVLPPNNTPIKNDVPANSSPEKVTTSPAVDKTPAEKITQTKSNTNSPSIQKQSAQEVIAPPQNSKTTKPSVAAAKTKKQEKATSPVKETKSMLTEEEYVFVEAKPQNGTAALYQYINQTLRYPAEVLDKKVSGEVLVNFVIDKNGRPKDVKFEKSLGAYFDEEALRVIAGMPDWIPASLNGIKMESKLSIPLFFNPKEK